jgi:IS1 family transposase
VLRPKARYSEPERQQILQAYRERVSLRGLQRIFGVWRATVLRWLARYVARLPTLPQSLVPAQADDVLEMDELVTFVSEKWFKRWLWTVQCRRTRQIVAFAIGDRSQDTGKLAWLALPDEYRRCPVYTDHWHAYPQFLPPAQHHPCDKGSGLTSHQERWYNTLRQ